MPSTPPSPPTPVRAALEGEDRVLVTTSQLAARIEDALECQLNVAVLEDLLLELDRGKYIEWVTITRDGEYVWDLTESPDRIADAVASVLVERFVGWLEE